MGFAALLLAVDDVEEKQQGVRPFGWGEPPDLRAV